MNIRSSITGSLLLSALMLVQGETALAHPCVAVDVRLRGSLTATKDADGVQSDLGRRVVLDLSQWIPDASPSRVAIAFRQTFSGDWVAAVEPGVLSAEQERGVQSSPNGGSPIQFDKQGIATNDVVLEMYIGTSSTDTERSLVTVTASDLSLSPKDESIAVADASKTERECVPWGVRSGGPDGADLTLGAAKGLGAEDLRGW